MDATTPTAQQAAAPPTSAMQVLKWCCAFAWIISGTVLVTYGGVSYVMATNDDETSWYQTRKRSILCTVIGIAMLAMMALAVFVFATKNAAKAYAA